MVYILGAGGIAREVLEIYRDLDRLAEVEGLIEEKCKNIDSSIKNKRLLDSNIIDSLPNYSKFIGAMGSPLRKRFLTKIEELGFDFETIIHPSAVIGGDVEIGKGCIICPGVVLTTEVSIGDHTIINANSTISHNCNIGEYVTICPGTNIAGNVTIKDSCWIGIGSVILQNISIGEASFIGAGTVVTNEIKDKTLAFGIPARAIKKMDELLWEKLV